MYKTLLITILVIFNIGAKAQDESAVQGVDIDSYAPRPDGTLITDRNYPDILLNTYAIVACRKADSISPIFSQEFYKNDQLSDPTLKNISDLSFDDKNYLCQLAWDTQNDKYFNLLIKLILADTLKKDHDIRVQMLKNLSAYNTPKTKKFLIKVIENNDKELSTIAAILLIQLGDYDSSMQFISKYYHNEHCPIEVHTALMQVNSNESVQLLKKMAKEEPDPAIAIDALAALSLLGYCNDAFKGFVDYTESTNEVVRVKAASCLAYYTGTEEAFKIIKEMQTDKSYLVKREIQKILRSYNNSNLKK